MSGRAIISYDDIAPSQPPEISSSSDQPPAKRRKKSKNASGGGRNTQHWDDPSPSVSHSHSYAQSHKAPSATAGRPRVGPREETRDLTHEEIWDDSALIDAWNAANEEYEVLNGPDKQWKSKPAHNSALWYSTLPDAPAGSQSGNAQDDSEPIDFDTFIPPGAAGDDDYEFAAAGEAQQKHLPAQVNANTTYFMPSVHTVPPANVTSEQALQNAFSAWYWTGYWTGVHRTLSAQKADNALTTSDEDYGNEDEDAGMEEVVADAA